MRRYVVPPLPASSITPESVWLDRRRLVSALAATPLLGLAGCARAEQEADRPVATDATVAPESVPDGVFRTAEEQTRYQDATSYNNFYEFGTDKADPGKYAYRLQTSPWSVQVTGHAETTGSFTLEDLLKPHTAQERIYRLRCVEGWSMVIPWSGIPLGEVLARFKPTSKAKYVAFTTLADKETMRGLRYRSIDWPYVEGLRIDEAMHPLTLLATGMYGRELANQNGAPLRLIVPWKYGFKSIKSIVKIDFVEEMPPTSWNELQASEYGFYSNVNPDVDHPRWSQKTERRLSGSGSRVFADRIPTLPFNGYGEQVASLYTGMDLRKWY